MAIEEKQLLEYGIEKFQSGDYAEALEVFVLCYMKGYEREWIIENIYSCYMTGNEKIFQSTYKNAPNVAGVYDECVLDFIPYMDGAYYIFDKECLSFRGIFSIDIFQEETSYAISQDMEFSAIALDIDWNWEEMKSVLKEAAQRKIYVVCQDIKRCTSFFKIPELQEYAKNVMLFENWWEYQKYFHENTAEYLPKIFCGTEDNESQFRNILQQEHEYRLTPEGRNTENVLLTIGIPTYDRGNLLLERLHNLSGLPYDAEIEFAISKNGTHYYQEEYKSVKTIPDARINYMGFDKELTMSENWQNVVKIAHGKFVMLVSDEDDVIPESLEHYLKLLSSHENLGYVRSKTVQQYSWISETKYYKKGDEAFLGGFLLQNYLSGVIYRREYFLNTDIEYWDRNYKENTFYHLYPHVWWQAVLAYQGDYAVDARCLIREGECVLFEQEKRYQQDNVEGKAGGVDEELLLTTISKYEKRIEQFKAMIQLIKDFKQLSSEQVKTRAFSCVTAKIVYLMVMVRDGYNYKRNEFPAWMEKLVEVAIAEINGFCKDDEQKKLLLMHLLENVKEAMKD